MARLVDASDRSFLVVFDGEVDAVSGRNVRLLDQWLRDDPLSEIVDLHPAYCTLLIRYDPMRCDPLALAIEIERRAAGISERPEREGRSFEIPVRYGGTVGPDLELVARQTGLTEAEVVALHASAAYEVRFVGFMPGFPYLSGLPEGLKTSRRETPRAVVPGGSVAIAGVQAGVYPVRSPGGWNVIGHTHFVLFDPARKPAATVAAGDRVRFVPVRHGR